MAALDAEALKRALDEHAVERLDLIEVFDEIESTNSYLVGESPPAANRGRVAVAEHQTEGRGRRARRWHSEPGRSLCLSMAWRYSPVPDELPAVTLAHGAAIVHALTRIGAHGLKLKWPNDILFGDAKLGGILTESRFLPGGDVVAVTGLGLNLAPVAADLSAGGWSGAISSLDAATEGGFERLHVAAAVIDAMTAAFDNFGALGLGAFRERYEKYDALVGRDVEVEAPDATHTGTVRGIDAAGALLVETGETTLHITAGSIRRILATASA